MKLNRRAVLAGIGVWPLVGCRSAAGDEPAPPTPIAPTRPRPGFHAGMSLAHVHRGKRGELGYGSPACLETLRSLKALGVTHISATPFGYQRALEDTAIVYGADSSLPDGSLLALAEQARGLGLAVCLKPHIWSNAFWRGDASRQDIDPGSEAGWRAWFQSYTAFAVHYAALAERMGAEVYCVGLEYLKATEQNPGAWAAVAEACRRVYGGALTYAANWWREVEIFADWSAYDFIGVNAYPPLTEHPDPDLQALVAGWDAHLDLLERVHRGNGERPVLVTEAGICATSGAAARPWDQGHRGAHDPELQARTYEALLHAGGRRPWLAGVYFWKVMTDPRASDIYQPTVEAREVLQRWWAPV